jgi:predicted nuclease of predicted toxin-antitoxin system
MIIFDENVEQHWIDVIAAQGHSCFVIRDKCPGISDNEVMEIVRSYRGLLITEDKDFGELIFSHQIPHVSVLFMRFDQPQYDQIEGFVLQAITEFLAQDEAQFITISRHKIRTRKL